MAEALVSRILVAVNDSPAALAAVGTAVVLARHTGARVRFVHVLGDDDVARALGNGDHEQRRMRERRSLAARSLLEHVTRVAERSEVVCDCRSLEGDAARALLGEARSWGAELVVIGRSDVRTAGRPYVGALTRHVLEFSDVPVLVVPRPAS
jgi:nucleotide-binding universal stress UspA family protein